MTMYECTIRGITKEFYDCKELAKWRDRMLGPRRIRYRMQKGKKVSRAIIRSLKDIMNEEKK